MSIEDATLWSLCYKTSHVDWEKPSKLPSLNG